MSPFNTINNHCGYIFIWKITLVGLKWLKVAHIVIYNTFIFNWLIFFLKYKYQIIKIKVN